MKTHRHHSNVQIQSAKLLTILLIAILSLTSLAGTALAQTDPTLIIDDGSALIRGDVHSFWVPIKLDPAGKTLSGVAFGIDYDSSCLTFDKRTDSNNDGVPDSVRQTQAGFDYRIRHRDITGDGNNDVIVSISTNTLVGPGQLQALDLDPDQTVTELRFDVKDTCGNVNGDPVTVNFDFITKPKHPRLPSFSDDRGKSVQGALDSGTYTLIFNAAPVTVALDNTAVAENQPAGTLIGTLSTTDHDLETYTYSFWACTGNDNYAFTISGDQLLTKDPYDYEDGAILGADHSFMACIRSTDPYGLYADGTFTITVTNVNEAPSDIQLSNWHVDENSGAGAAIGTLTTTDPDAGDSHTYSLVNTVDCPGPDLASFQFDAVTPNELEAAVDFDAETKDTYEICIRSTDAGTPAKSLDRPFTINVDYVNETPIAVDDPDVPVIVYNTGAPYTFDVLANDIDPDGDNLFVASATQPITGGAVSLVGSPRTTSVEFTPQAGYSGPVTFTYKAQEDFGFWTGLQSNDATVSFYVVAEEDRGDCNNDGNVDAADLSATSLEIFDNNAGTLDWKLIYLGDFAGSPVGCDSNGSENGLDGQQKSVDASDLTCTVRLFFGEACTTAASAAIEMPGASASLSVGDVQMANGSVVVPVTLDTAGQNVAAAAFVVEFDPALFSVDMTDADGDNVPDAIALNVPAGIVKVVSVDNDSGRIQIAVFGTTLPLPLLENGVIASVTLDGKASVTGQSVVNLSRVSMGDDQGQRLAVMTDNGVITFGTGEGGGLFLPLLQAP